MGNDWSASYALRRLASPSASYALATRNAAAAALRSASERVVHLSGCHVAAARRYARRIDRASASRDTPSARYAAGTGARIRSESEAPPRVPRAPARRLGGELARRAVQRRRPAPRPARRARPRTRPYCLLPIAADARTRRASTSPGSIKRLAQIARRDAKRSARTRRRLIIAVVRLLRLIIVRVARRVLCGLRSVRSARHAETVHVHIHVLVQRVEDGLRAPAQQIAARRSGTASVSRRFLKTRRFFYAPTRAGAPGPGPRRNHSGRASGVASASPNARAAASGLPSSIASTPRSRNARSLVSRAAERRGASRAAAIEEGAPAAAGYPPPPPPRPAASAASASSTSRDAPRRGRRARTRSRRSRRGPGGSRLRFFVPSTASLPPRTACVTRRAPASPGAAQHARRGETRGEARRKRVKAERLLHMPTTASSAAASKSGHDSWSGNARGRLFERTRPHAYRERPPRRQPLLPSPSPFAARAKSRGLPSSRAPRRKRRSARRGSTFAAARLRRNAAWL